MMMKSSGQNAQTLVHMSKRCTSGTYSVVRPERTALYVRNVQRYTFGMYSVIRPERTALYVRNVQRCTNSTYNVVSTCVDVFDFPDGLSYVLQIKRIIN
jgi:hypothetical protein